MNRLTLVFFLGVGLLGCPRHIDFGPEGPITEPDVLLAKVRAAEEQLVSLEGDASLRVDAEQGKGSIQLFVAVARPALVHIEAMDFFGKPQGVLVSDGQVFGFYDGNENRYFRGPASAQNLARFLPVVLPPRELVGLLMGAPPRLQSEQASLAWDEGQRLYRLTLARPPVTQTLWVDPVHFRVRRSEVQGARTYDVSFDEYALRNQARLPFKMELTARAPQAELLLKYTQVKVNERLDLTLFEPLPPEGVPVVEVDEAGRPVPPAATPAD